MPDADYAGDVTKTAIATLGAKMIKEERYEFLQTNAVHAKCTDAACEKYRWSRRN